MSRAMEWTDERLYELAECVSRMTWRQVSAEYQMSEEWMKAIYRRYQWRVKKGVFSHWTPFRLMNLYLERQRGASVDALAQSYKVNVLEITRHLGEAKRLVEGQP